MIDERDRTSQHLVDLARTRDALDELIAAAQEHREGLRPPLADAV